MHSHSYPLLSLRRCDMGLLGSVTVLRFMDIAGPWPVPEWHGLWHGQLKLYPDHDATAITLLPWLHSHSRSLQCCEMNALGCMSVGSMNSIAANAQAGSRAHLTGMPVSYTLGGGLRLSC